VWNFEMQNAHQRMPALMRILLFEIFHKASKQVALVFPKEARAPGALISRTLHYFAVPHSI
jgi:hypothetical protein